MLRRILFKTATFYSLSLFQFCNVCFYTYDFDNLDSQTICYNNESLMVTIYRLEFFVTLTGGSPNLVSDLVIQCTSTS